MATNNKSRWRLAALVLLCNTAFTASSLAAEPHTITIYMTVDWEGWSLDEENLEAMRSFRKRYPHIPMLQLLNPVYFTRPNINPEEVSNKIRSTLLQGDEHGLHLHAWKTLIERCGLTYKNTHSFADVSEDCPGRECGYTVSLEFAYSQEELTKLVACSASLLTDQGFDRPTSFRAGGWQLGPKLAAALQANNFIWDSSNTDGRLLESRWDSQSGLVKMVKALHPDSTPLDQPHELLPGLVEYPNNASLADYTSPQVLLEIFRSLIENRKSVMVLGFHQETAFNFLRHLEEAIPMMEKEAQANDVKIEWAQYSPKNGLK